MSDGELTKNKRLISPVSTSGDGYVFEHSIQAFFVIQMLTGGLVPRMGNCQITKVALQAARYGRKTDDCEITLKDNFTGIEKTLLVQIKRSFKLSKSNEDFTKTVKDAWKDFNSQGFDKSSDKIMLVAGSLDRYGVGLKHILTHIQSSYRSAEQFWRDYDNNLLGRNKQELEGLSRLRKELTLANEGNPIDKDIEFEFFRSFYIVKSDMHESLFEYGDINIALIHSILAQKRWKNDIKPQTVWERLCNYLATRNKDQIELIKGNLPAKLWEIFEEEKVIQQSDTLSPAGNKQSSKKLEPPNNNSFMLNTNYKKELALLCLIGEFDSTNSSDQKMVSKLLGIDFNSVLNIAQSIASSDKQIIKLNDTVWKISDIKSTLEQLSDHIYDNHVDTFADIYLKILSELDPALDLPIGERYLANIGGKNRAYSDTVRRGVASGMAMLANNQDIFDNCSANKIFGVANHAIIKLLSDNQNPKLWMSIADNVSLIAQTAPSQFLSILEKSLAIKDNNPILAIIKESTGDSFFQTDYMTGLRWALADLSWDKNYFSRASLALARISNYETSQSEEQSRSLDIILHTILPWRPKTLASVKVQHSVVEKIINEYRTIGRQLLKGLLPNVTRTTMERESPEWLSGSADLEPVTQQELWKQNSYYSNLYVNTAESAQEIVDVINDVDHLTEDAFDIFTTQIYKALGSMAGEDKRSVWESLIKKINRLNQYDEKKDERSKKLKEIADKLEPADDLYKSIYLFSNHDHDLMNHRDWEKGLDDIREKRQHALLNILKSHDPNKLGNLVNQSKLPYVIGSTLGPMDYPSLEESLFPKFLNGSEAEKEFIRSFIYSRYFYYEGSNDWIGKLDFANWSDEQKNLFLLALPFSKSTWDLLDTQQSESITKGYWTRVDDFRHAGSNEYSESAVRNLLKARRPLAAIRYIDWVLMAGDSSIKQKIDPELCLEVLLASLNTTENLSSINRLQYELGSVFKHLYNNTDFVKTDLWKAEWAYLKFFGKYGIGQPRALIYQITNDADFFCELIRIAYKSELPGVEQQELDDAILYNLLKVLSFNDFTIMPGMDQNNVFHEDNFTGWINKVEELCKASGHLDIARSVIGGYLINSPEDESGLWIHRSVAKILDRNDSASMRSGYSTGIRNARGMHAVDETGQAEASLRDKWQRRADRVESLGFLNFAISLRELADTYERERNRVIKRKLFND